MDFKVILTPCWRENKKNSREVHTAMNSDKKIVIILAVMVAALIAELAYLHNGSEITGAGEGKQRIVISLGQDLTDEQKQAMIDYFEDFQGGRDARYITVTNREEREYLQGKVDEDLIGTRAISSAYCEVLSKGRGIEVTTHNITAITPFMYANALITAGIEDARVVVGAPFEVSGTAALTGIIKAFESASGEKLNEGAKEIAHQEIAESTKLGQKVGKANAEKIIYEVKRQVIEKDISDPGEIRRIVVEISGDLNVDLSEEDIDRIVGLMQKINQLNINISWLEDQLMSLERNLGEVKNVSRDVVGLLQQLISLLNKFIDNARSMLVG